MTILKFKDFEQLNESIKPSRIYKKEIIDGYEILIGKNAEMNDILTFEIANDNDLWFHVSSVPGSHVVIRKKDEEIPKDIIKKAAELAVKNSKAQGKVKVVYTERKNVTKNNSHKIGQVSVDYNKSNFISIDTNVSESYSEKDELTILKETYPHLTFNMKPHQRFKDAYICNVYKGDNYLGGVRGPCSYENGIDFFKNIAKNN